MSGREGSTVPLERVFELRMFTYLFLLILSTAKHPSKTWCVKAVFYTVQKLDFDLPFARDEVQLRINPKQG